MRCFGKWTIGLASLAGIAALAAGLGGCSGGGNSSSTPSTTSDGSTPSGSGNKPLAIESRGSISGRVVVKNPDKKDLEALNKKRLADMSKDEKFKPCHTDAKESEVQDQTWFISDDGGLANVAVWLAAPSGHYFKLADEDLKPDTGGWERHKKLEQPHCAFMPHVMVMFTHHKDNSGKDKPTEQELVTTNTSPTDHNTKVSLNSELFNQLIKPDSEAKITGLTPKSKPFEVTCNVHTWMKAYIWDFDHPFATVTDKDGKFTIKNAPAGTELKLMVWHEKLEAIDVKNSGKVTLDKDKDKDFGTIEVEYQK